MDLYDKFDEMINELEEEGFTWYGVELIDRHSKWGHWEREVWQREYDLGTEVEYVAIDVEYHPEDGITSLSEEPFEVYPVNTIKFEVA